MEYTQHTPSVHFGRELARAYVANHDGLPAVPFFDRALGRLPAGTVLDAKDAFVAFTIERITLGDTSDELEEEAA
jgi:hypothetical protein